MKKEMMIENRFNISATAYEENIVYLYGNFKVDLYAASKVSEVIVKELLEYE